MSFLDPKCNQDHNQDVMAEDALSVIGDFSFVCSELKRNVHVGTPDEMSLSLSLSVGSERNAAQSATDWCDERCRNDVL
jgi:hypothetical protein